MPTASSESQTRTESGALPLTRQVAIVTGGARGIGREIALRLARAGADVALFDVTPELLERTAGELRELGRRAEGFSVDVTDGKQVEDGVAKVLDKLGGIDILINNADRKSTRLNSSHNVPSRMPSSA